MKYWILTGDALVDSILKQSASATLGSSGRPIIPEPTFDNLPDRERTLVTPHVYFTRAFTIRGYIVRSECLVNRETA